MPSSLETLIAPYFSNIFLDKCTGSLKNLKRLSSQEIDKLDSLPSLEELELTSSLTQADVTRLKLLRSLEFGVYYEPIELSSLPQLEKLVIV